MGWVISHVWHLAGQDIEKTCGQICQKVRMDDVSALLTRQSQCLAPCQVAKASAGQDIVKMCNEICQKVACCMMTTLSSRSACRMIYLTILMKLGD